MRAIAFALVLLIVACGPSSPPTRAVVAVECHAGPPVGALAAEVPFWCIGIGPSRESAVRGDNVWVDGFAGGAVHGPLASSYRVFESARTARGTATTVYRTMHIAHNNHWMVDIAGHGAPGGIYEGAASDFFTGPNNGGGLMRPDAAFRFEDGKLTVEFDVAAGMLAYGDRVWPEVVVTTAPAPTGHETNGWYAAGLFGGAPAVACSFPSDRLSECRVYDDAQITARLSGHETAGATTSFGGAPAMETLAAAWHQCGAADPDSVCRDRFRVVFERDALTVFVNGVRYMEHRGLPANAQLPAALLSSPVYVYFASWAYLADWSVARVHWGRIAINPALQLMR